MNKVRICTDSVADIPEELCEKFNITVLPITVNVNGKEYREGIDIKPNTFYGLLEECETIPTSSQINISAYSEMYKKLFDEGYTDVIYVSLNSNGSGSFNSAQLARNLFYEMYPAAKESFNIYNIDSLSYSMIYGYSVLLAAEMALNGADAAAITEKIQSVLKCTRGIFVPLTLRFVKKSGRISAAAAFAGDAIGIKPLLSVENGEINIISKVRGEKRIVNELLDICNSERKENTPYIIICGNNDNIRDELRNKFTESLGITPELEYKIGCVVAMNTGPDVIGVVYFTDDI